MACSRGMVASCSAALLLGAALMMNFVLRQRPPGIAPRSVADASEAATKAQAVVDDSRAMRLNRSLTVSPQHGRVLTNDVAAACRMACVEEPIGFHAASAEARSLFRGCGKSAEARSLFRGLIVIGTQKGGTTSLDSMLRRSFCSRGECQFWNLNRWKDGPVPQEVVTKQYLHKWASCAPGHLLLDKSPSYDVVPHTALRICESLGQTKLVYLLRDPVRRAYSAFFWTLKVFSPKVINDTTGVARTPEGFHVWATIDIAVVRSCGGLPTGDPQLDKAAAKRFVTCCSNTVAKLGQRQWRGCSCSTHTLLRVRGGASRWCNLFGDIHFAPVRLGIYVHFLRIWLQYHRAQDLLIFTSEEFYKNMPQAGRELSCFARPSDAPELCKKKIDAASAASSGRAKEPPMLDRTRQMLQEFYAPYNKQLEALLGRGMSWS